MGVATRGWINSGRLARSKTEVICLSWECSAEKEGRISEQTFQQELIIVEMAGGQSGGGVGRPPERMNLNSSAWLL